MSELKPVAWQFKLKDEDFWRDCSCDTRSWYASEGFETRELYAIPDGYEIARAEPTDSMLDEVTECEQARLKLAISNYCQSMNERRASKKFADAQFHKGSVVDEKA